MTGRDLGFLLLCSHLGDGNRKPLSAAQLRTLGRRVRNHRNLTGERLTAEALMTMGCSREEARRVLELLHPEMLGQQYVQKAQAMGITMISRADPGYPRRLLEKLGDDSPGVLWARGDLSLLQKPGVAVVGSRDLNPRNALFAGTAGREAARQGYVLISGNARGADRIAMDGAAGGGVIAVIPDRLDRKKPGVGELYLSLYDYDADFTAQRALERNHVIHALGLVTLVAQSDAGHGGTWSGTCHNLKNHLSPVWCCDDGSEAVERYRAMGAGVLSEDALRDLKKLTG